VVDQPGDVVIARRIPLGGLLNFRDLGGYQTVDGLETRRGRVFRSDSLHHLGLEDLDAFDALGVEAIYDLRRETELLEAPGPRPYVHVQLPSRRVSETDPSTLRTRADGERWLYEDYCGMLDNGAAVFARLFGHFAEDRLGPVVFHCWSGKDRTGVTAALLLTALGVGRETVLVDYELTSKFRGFEHAPDVVDIFVSTGIARPAAEAMLSTPRWAMAAALDHLEAAYGGIESYLVASGGLTSDLLRELTARLTHGRRVT
jgi:protein-tyrosine phosphatase